MVRLLCEAVIDIGVTPNMLLVVGTFVGNVLRYDGLGFVRGSPLSITVVERQRVDDASMFKSAFNSEDIAMKLDIPVDVLLGLERHLDNVVVELNDDLSVSLVDKIDELVMRGIEVVETKQKIIKKKKCSKESLPIYCRKSHLKSCSNCSVDIFQFTISIRNRIRALMSYTRTGLLCILRSR